MTLILKDDRSGHQQTSEDHGSHTERTTSKSTHNSSHKLTGVQTFDRKGNATAVLPDCHTLKRQSNRVQVYTSISLSMLLIFFNLKIRNSRVSDRNIGVHLHVIVCCCGSCTPKKVGNVGFFPRDTMDQGQGSRICIYDVLYTVYVVLTFMIMYTF